MIEVTGTIKDGLLQKLRASGDPDDAHAIAAAVNSGLPMAKSVFNAQKKTVTIAFDEDQFIAFVIERGLKE